MRPILLKGHERSITYVSYSQDGDLIFTASKDNVPTVWDAKSGERMGTYNGHQGAVWDMDTNKFCSRVLTASADATVKLWETTTGVCLQTFPHRGPVRGIAFSEGGSQYASISDPFMENEACVSIYNIPEGPATPPSDYKLTPLLEIGLPKTPGQTTQIKATNVVWLNLNEALFVTFDDGSIRLYDPVSGDLLDTLVAHTKKVIRVSFNATKTLFVTSSADFTAKLYDAVSLQHLKTYTTDRPVNAAVIHPTKEHVLLGGGQEAMSVTTTSGRSGKFETKFFHLVYEEEFGIVTGHFGPINALAVSPDGLSFCSGAEDGYIRLHFFDESYLKMKDLVTEDGDDEKVEGEGAQ